MTEPEKKTSLKEVSVTGARSSNAFRQNLRRAKNKAKTSRDKRRHIQTKRRARTKIRLNIKDTLSGKGRSRVHTRKKSILKTKEQIKGPQRGKTLKRHRKVRWKDQETGASLVSYSNTGGELVTRESPLFRKQRPLRMRFTQKRRHKEDEDASRETNIVVRWKIHDEPKSSIEDDILGDVETISNMDVEEASKRLREVGIETDRKAPIDLIKNLAILSHGLDNGSIQTRG